MLPAIIDIEASGFGRASYPIEVCAVLPDGKSCSHIIKPDNSWIFWDETAEAIHGISREVLLSSGEQPMAVARALNELLRGETIYTDAWCHDTSWLGKLYDLTGICQLFKLDSLRTLMSEQQASLWHPTKDRVIKDLHLKRHRASIDAFILQETFKRTQLLAQSEEISISYSFGN